MARMDARERQRFLEALRTDPTFLEAVRDEILGGTGRTPRPAEAVAHAWEPRPHALAQSPALPGRDLPFGRP